MASISNTIEWRTSPLPVPYTEALTAMEERVDAIRQGEKPGLVWLLEHPPLYTAGTSAKAEDLLQHDRFPVYATGRGGQYTYHGPGQRVAYVMLDLKQLFAPNPPDLRRYVFLLEEWIIRTLATFGVTGERREGRVGIWVPATHHKAPDTKDQESKIAAIGVRVRGWVSYHGIAINVHPDLSHYQGIVPCGIQHYGVTSLAALGIHADMHDINTTLHDCFYTTVKHQATDNNT